MLSKIQQHPLIAVLCYLPIYSLCFSILEKVPRPYFLVHCAVDDLIPFWIWAIVPYLSWFIWVPAMFMLFLLHSKPEVFRVLVSLVCGTAASLTLYVLFPTGLNLRQPLVGSDLFTNLIRWLYSTDTSTNVCPSLHVYVTLIILFAIFSSKWATAPLFRIVNAAIGLSICASTVLIDQHSVLDLICGALLAATVYTLVSVFCSDQEQARMLETPQHRRKNRRKQKSLENG